MNLPYHIILGSKSPRRQELLKSLDLEFEIKVRSVDEAFPSDLPVDELAEFIARKKSEAFSDIQNQELVITSDTVVVCNNEPMAKASSANEALEMLTQLSGKTHQVITGVCIKTKESIISFSEATQVTFRHLEEDEIEYYIDKYKPFDKAGAYGIQEWIGMIGIESITGDFYNVMGLPLHRLYLELNKLK